MEMEESFRKETPEPDLVPIVDCLVSVIFFLLFSTTFIELTKIVVPPAAVSNATMADSKVPVSPKFFLSVNGNTIDLQLSWGGSNPGKLKGNVIRVEAHGVSAALESKVKEMADEFQKSNANENTMQIALSKDASYQEMINMMDGLMKSKKTFDIVLMSPNEVANKDVR